MKIDVKNLQDDWILGFVCLGCCFQTARSLSIDGISTISLTENDKVHSAYSGSGCTYPFKQLIWQQREAYMRQQVIKWLKPFFEQNFGVRIVHYLIYYFPTVRLLRFHAPHENSIKNLFLRCHCQICRLQFQDLILAEMFITCHNERRRHSSLLVMSIIIL